MKILLTGLAFVLLAATTAASAVCAPPLPSGSDTTISPTLMLGLTYRFGGSNPKDNLGLTAKLLSSNEANNLVVGGGMSVYPTAKEKVGIDIGIGINGTNVTAIAGYDLLARTPQISAGWAHTAERTPLIDYCAPSDARLKTDIRLVSIREDGIKLYAFRYLWSDETYVGVMAQDLVNDPARRAAVVTMAHGLYAVDYRVLGLKMSTAEAWRAHGFDAVRL